MSNHKLMDKYNPKEFEENLYNEWEKKGYFKPSMDKRKESFCIVMPPPNVTGKLHIMGTRNRPCSNCNRSKSCRKNEKRRRINKN